MKVFFYGHSVGMGAGHFARSLRLAEAAIERGWECRVLSAGSALQTLNKKQVPLLEIPTLEGAQTDLSRLAERGRLLARFVQEWKPDAVVVDLLPFGYGGELVEALSQQSETKFLLGLPYAEREVKGPKNPRLIRALNRYAGVVIYTDPAFEDPLPAYRDFGLPERRMYTGVVTETLSPGRQKEPTTIALLVGGGGLPGSHELCRRLADVLPCEVCIRYVLGPLARVPEGLPSNVTVICEATLEEALNGVSGVVSRVGYNTSYALLTTGLPVVFVPTAWPEQYSRAKSLSRLPGVMLCEEDDLESARAVLSGGLVERKLPFRTDGAEHAMVCLERLVGERVA